MYLLLITVDDIKAMAKKKQTAKKIFKTILILLIPSFLGFALIMAQPDFGSAIVMVGSGNKYDHPYIDILSKWESSGAKIYRTDINGNIVVTSNGQNLDIKTSK